MTNGACMNTNKKGPHPRAFFLLSALNAFGAFSAFSTFSAFSAFSA